MACGYVTGHAVLLFVHVVTLFVAVNSADQVSNYAMRYATLSYMLSCLPACLPVVSSMHATYNQLTS